MVSRFEELVSTRLKAGIYRTSEGLSDRDDTRTAGPLYHYRLPPLEIVQRDTLLNALSNGLAFPDYFGANWDAAFDCLTDRDWEAGAVVIIELPIPPAAVVDEAALTTLIDLVRDACRFWSDQHVTVYFLIECPRGDLASLSEVPALESS
jgi:hypothetical protein